MSNFQSSKSVILKNVRLDYNDFYEPRISQNGKGKAKYKCKAIFAPASEAFESAKAGMIEAAKLLWGDNYMNVLQSIPSNSKAVRDGNTMIDGNGAIIPAYAGMKFISASNNMKPQIIAARKHNGEFVTIAQNGKAYVKGIDVTHELGYELKAPYRGCYGNLKVQFIAGKTMKGADGESLPNQVYARLEAFQFTKDGEAFGPGPTSAEGFEDDDTAGSVAAPVQANNDIF